MADEEILATEECCQEAVEAGSDLPEAGCEETAIPAETAEQSTETEKPDCQGEPLAEPEITE